MSDEETEILLHAPNISVSVIFSAVRIEIWCRGEYEAQVLFDDLVSRLQSGQEITIEPTPADKRNASRT